MRCPLHTIRCSPPSVLFLLLLLSSISTTTHHLCYRPDFSPSASARMSSFIIPSCLILLQHPPSLLLFCSISSILSSFLAFPTCCIHYQPLVMHIYCLQRARLIQHAAAESKSSPFPRLTCSLVYCRGQHKHLLFTV